MLNPLTRINQAATKLTEKAPEILGRVAQERDDALRRQVHDSRTAAILGICLGVAFLACFLTGLYSHYQQHPPLWLAIPPQPSWLYQVTQGVHVASGLASVPLLLAKLWTAYPRLFKWPPVEGVSHAIERLMLVPLVFGSLFMLFSGVANVARWYPWEFFFPAAHFHAAWITIGALSSTSGRRPGPPGARCGASRLHRPRLCPNVRKSASDDADSWPPSPRRSAW